MSSHNLDYCENQKAWSSEILDQVNQEEEEDVDIFKNTKNFSSIGHTNSPKLLQNDLYNNIICSNTGNSTVIF
jgi:bacterioferritin (cytochrome b1)